jgi:hypothetical protein
MTIPALVYIWHKITARDIGRKAMLPFNRHSRLADSSFTAGHAYRFMVEEERRSLEQNSKMWAMLTEVSNQIEHCGRHYSPDQWKAIFMHAWGQQVEFLPSLDGRTFVPYGHSSSKLSKREMAELFELIIAEGTQRGVKFADDPADHDRQTG